MEKKLCFVPSVHFRPNRIKGKYFKKNTSINKFLSIAPKAKSIGTRLILLKHINIFISYDSNLLYHSTHPRMYATSVKNSH